mmetsp:Transcript_7724/g.15849  ORF Transcript_7724/g.15849 Transcript_7724/m.15849 type:complete len:270 (+) Transcript_7724:198-1007(+)
MNSPVTAALKAAPFPAADSGTIRLTHDTPRLSVSSPLLSASSWVESEDAAARLGSAAPLSGLAVSRPSSCGARPVPLLPPSKEHEPKGSVGDAEEQGMECAASMAASKKRSRSTAVVGSVRFRGSASATRSISMFRSEGQVSGLFSKYSDTEFSASRDEPSSSPASSRSRSAQPSAPPPSAEKQGLPEREFEELPLADGVAVPFPLPRRLGERYPLLGTRAGGDWRSVANDVVEAEEEGEEEEGGSDGDEDGSVKARANTSTDSSEDED